MKTPEYFWNKDYKIVFKAILKEEGGGFTAYMPELGRNAFIGDGDTKEEALASLKSIFFHLIAKYIELGQEIPLPKKEHRYSGTFSVRVSPELHETIVEQAEDAGISLNQYITECLAAASVGNCTIAKIDHHFASIKNFNEALIQTTALSVGVAAYTLKKSTEATWGLQ